MRSGLLVILLGIIYLLSTLNYITPIQLSILLPIVVIYIGIAMVTRDRCWHCGIWHESNILHKKAGVCDCEDCGPVSKKRSSSK